jgi:integrase
MATFKEYKKKNGEKLWMVTAYLGIDYVTGKQVNVTIRNAKTKKEAQSKLNKKRLEFETGISMTEVNYTFQQVYDDWIEQYQHTVKESTFVKTKRIFKNHILPYFGEMRIKKIKVQHCQKAINFWAKNLKRFKMVMNYAGMVFDYAIRIELISTNPTKLVTKPMVKDNVEEKEDNFYTKEQLKLFFNALEKENEPKIYSLFRVLAYTGMRKGEALALTWNDINFEDQTITINKTLTRGEESKLIIQTPKTGNSKRVVSVDDETLSILKKWHNTQKKSYFLIGINTINKNQLVFSNLKNEFLQPTVTRKYMKQVCDKHKLKPITTHGFRHTHCSLLFEAGASIKEVQDRLGHTDIQTTMNIYVHVSQRKKDETAARFANFMSN